MNCDICQDTGYLEMDGEWKQCICRDELSSLPPTKGWTEEVEKAAQKANDILEEIAERS